MTKSWADMDREELLVEKGKWESHLQRINLDLKSARRKAAATGIFLPLEEMEALENLRLKAVSCVRGLQCELSKRNPLVRQRKSFNDYFFDEADAVLGDVVFNKIYDQAYATMQSERRQVDEGTSA